ncbi:winged helix-turn-helix domain-containing protein [Aquirhabdus sp.]|uniref:winged helix-turn-helix domain-containing protein n=1 Tax=Aquirhabdus sp. TaxID=2824160 RepID=UPI00396C6DFB
MSQHPTKEAHLLIRARLLYGEEIAIGPGKVDLLAAISEKGSISAAAKHMSMSYRRAWLLVDTMNRCFKEPLVISTAGGKQGGGAQLSTLGLEMLKNYRTLTSALEHTAAQYVEDLQKHLLQRE